MRSGTISGSDRMGKGIEHMSPLLRGKVKGSRRGGRVGRGRGTNQGAVGRFKGSMKDGHLCTVAVGGSPQLRIGRVRIEAAEKLHKLVDDLSLIRAGMGKGTRGRGHRIDIGRGGGGEPPLAAVGLGWAGGGLGTAEEAEAEDTGGP